METALGVGPLGGLYKQPFLLNCSKRHLCLTGQLEAPEMVIEEVSTFGFVWPLSSAVNPVFSSVPRMLSFLGFYEE